MALRLARLDRVGTTLTRFWAVDWSNYDSSVGRLQQAFSVYHRVPVFLDKDEVWSGPEDGVEIDVSVLGPNPDLVNQCVASWRVKNPRLEATAMRHQDGFSITFACKRE